MSRTRIENSAAIAHVCVCVRERENVGERESKRERKSERARKKDSERERERAKEGERVFQTYVTYAHQK